MDATILSLVADPRLATTVRTSFNKNGFKVVHATAPKHDLFSDRRWDLIVLEGGDVDRTVSIAARNNRSTIISLTRTYGERLCAIESDADIVINMNLSDWEAELVVRSEITLDRIDKAWFCKVGDLFFTEEAELLVYVDGRRVRLQLVQYRVLLELAQHAGEPVPLERFKGPPFFFNSPNTYAVHVSHINERLGRLPTGKRRIACVRNTGGYKLVIP